MSESSIQREIRVRLSQLRKPFFRYQVGTFLSLQGAMVHIGEKGVSDLIGMTPYVVQPEDVGRTIAVFTALEIKTAKGRLREEQAPFLRMVNSHGGLGAIVRSAEDAEAVTTEMWKCELVRKYSSD
jgi:hypothetical protein